MKKFLAIIDQFLNWKWFFPLLITLLTVTAVITNFQELFQPINIAEYAQAYD